MEQELAGAKTDEEKEAIKAKHKKQIAKVDDKITVVEENIETAKKDPVKPNKTETKPDKPKPDKPEKVWGIIKPAWDEPVTKYRTEIVEKYFDDYDSCYEYSEELDLQGIANSFYLTQVEEQVAYTEVIHHEAVYGGIEK